ncbi:MAG: hypothetical protein HY286_09760 [Planctomycetes bacterium]|nr:hypothetical protein [Planctomycetota bacterium]
MIVKLYIVLAGAALASCGPSRAEQIAESIRRMRDDPAPNRNIEPRAATRPAPRPQARPIPMELTKKEPGNNAPPRETPAAKSLNINNNNAAAGPDLDDNSPEASILSASAPAASKPASSAAASAPAPAADAELEQLTTKISALASLRASAGDAAGASRLRQRVALWRLEYKKGNRERAIVELKKTAAEADR